MNRILIAADAGNVKSWNTHFLNPQTKETMDAKTNHAKIISHFTEIIIDMI